MRFAFFAAVLAAGGCTPDREEGANEGARTASPTAVKGRVADLAGVLDEMAERRLAHQVDRVKARNGKQLFVVTVPVGKGETLEQFGWAVRTPSGTRALLIDPEGRTVRIEAPLPAKAKGAIVRDMRPALAAGRLEQALLLGIERLGA